MKKIMLFFALLTLFTACNKDLEITPEGLQGKWRNTSLEDFSYFEEYVFLSDNTYSRSENGGSYESGTYEIRSAKGKKMELRLKPRVLFNLFNQSYKMKITMVGKRTILIQSRNGAATSFSRIP